MIVGRQDFSRITDGNPPDRHRGIGWNLRLQMNNRIDPNLGLLTDMGTGKHRASSSEEHLVLNGTAGQVGVRTD